MTEARPDDAELVARARSGDPAAREELGRRLGCVRPLVVSLNRRRGSPLGESELEDVAQDAIAVAWRALERFQYGRLEAWVYRIVTLEWLHRLRARHYGPVLLEDVGAAPPSAEDSDNLQLFEAERVYQGLDELGPPENVVIRLKLLEDCTFAEIAERMSRTEGTVKAWYYRGLRRLRGLVDQATRVAGERR